MSIIRFAIAVLFLLVNTGIYGQDGMLSKQLYFIDSLVINKQNKFGCPIANKEYEIRRTVVVLSLTDAGEISFREIPFGYEDVIFDDVATLVSSGDFSKKLSRYLKEDSIDCKIIRVYNFYLSGPTRIHSRKERSRICRSVYDEIVNQTISSVNEGSECILNIDEVFVSIGYPKI
jgi:hypothetical protein